MQQSLAAGTPRIGARDLREGVLVAGKYRIDQLIARGGMGLVFRAVQPSIARSVALKVVRPELLSHPDASENLLTEARVLGRFQNDHVCRILDAGRLDDGAPYLVLEYVDGTDLRVQLNREKRIEPTRAVGWVMDLLEALAEAHALGIVHRDVKPENLVLGETPNGSCVKLLDFGICSAPHVPGAAQRRFAADYGVGSPHYMAPEQISSPDAGDHRIDIWSVGVVLFELLSGQPPFEGDTAISICAQVLAREPVALTELVPNLPAGLARIVQRCLSKEPDQRYANVEELATALAPYASPAAREALPRIRRTSSSGATVLDASHGAGDRPPISTAGPASRRARAALGELSPGAMASVLGSRSGAPGHPSQSRRSASNRKESS